MKQPTYSTELIRHYQATSGAMRRRLFMDDGPIQKLPIGFYVAEFSVNARWMYATIGLGEHAGFEFHVIAPRQDSHHVRTVSVVSSYAIHGPGLGMGHTVNLGEPWLPGSVCDHLLLSLPYLDGPKLEHFSSVHGSARCLWLLPITEAERDFKSRSGLEALEQLFEDCEIDYTNPARESIV